MGERLRLPLEAEPELAAEPLTSLKIACEYWHTRQINEAADRDDLIRATRLVNGGLNGLEDRRQYLQKAKTALAALEGLRVSQAQGGTTVALRRGSFGDAVQQLQELLAAQGYPLSIDRDFGPATELAVMQFQQRAGLLVDGIVGQKTWAALRSR